MCTLLARCLVGFIERIFLARCSIEALEGGMTGVFLSNVFQSACINMGNMTQVFLGERLKGDQKDIFGKVSWQMIWFSLLSMVFTLPLSFFLSLFFSEGLQWKRRQHNIFP